MKTRLFPLACIVPLFFASVINAGEYQQTSDRQAYVWNNYPRPGDSASWSGNRDSQGYATGYGTITWYKNGRWASRYSATMVNGKLTGFVTNQDADGRRFQGTYVNGKQSSDWSEVTEAPDIPNTAAVSQPETVELVAAGSAGNIDYALTGMGNSGAMQLRVVNKTEREWLVEVEVGTKLEPSSGNAQSMVVTREIEVHVHPHDSNTVELQVACLDISKPPPMPSDTDWSAQVSSSLAAFIACVNRTIADIVASAPDDKRLFLQNLQPFILQGSLWKARGATSDDWVDFFVHYMNMTQDQARQKGNAMEQVTGLIVDQCPSI